MYFSFHRKNCLVDVSLQINKLLQVPANLIWSVTQRVKLPGMWNKQNQTKTDNNHSFGGLRVDERLLLQLTKDVPGTKSKNIIWWLIVNDSKICE